MRTKSGNKAVTEMSLNRKQKKEGGNKAVTLCKANKYLVSLTQKELLPLLPLIGGKGYKFLGVEK